MSIYAPAVSYVRQYHTVDDPLVQRCKLGDDRAFEELVAEYEERIFRLAYRYTGTRCDAEDVAQDIFVAVYRSIGSFRGQSSLTTWIYRVAINHCLAWQRRRKPEHAPLNESTHYGVAHRESDPEDRARLSELKSELERALAALNTIHREVVILHELHGLTYVECADVLGIPVGTVKSRLSNAFTQLRLGLTTYTMETT